ncbi:p450 domain-containing [Olea europaea subsp. europaea]|uniref:p450 domain-containing n=1 Tax=Olea europaea subsp. europaea TaxID=158383 RepID=A0A8S0SQA1_OLEEU|nr:p450 domain-containing [Olea europaea subsp. europaea]
MKIMFFELIRIVMMRMIAGKRYYSENVEKNEIKEAKKFREITMEISRIVDASNMEYYLPVLGLLGDGRTMRNQFLLRRDPKTRFLRISGTYSTLVRVSSLSYVIFRITLPLPSTLEVVLLAAGTKTTATTMEWALSLLLNNPKVLKKAKIEIDNLVGDERLLEESDMIKLPYLRFIINETLRMYNLAPLLVPHHSSEECFVGGYCIPTDTMLLVNLWAIQNDLEIWKDPGKFQPERFEDLRGTRDGFKFMPYGFGRRGCPEEALASRIIGLALGLVIQCFDLENFGKEMVDMTEGIEVSLSKAQPLMAMSCPRPIATKLFSP